MKEPSAGLFERLFRSNWSRVHELEHFKADAVASCQVGNFDLVQIRRIYLKDTRAGVFSSLDVDYIADKLEAEDPTVPVYYGVDVAHGYGNMVDWATLNSLQPVLLNARNIALHNLPMT